MALPNSNLEIDMVRGALGAATNNVGQLCIHPNVNKWSKRKPVKHSSVSPITDNDVRMTDCGFIVQSYDMPYKVLNAILAGAEWVYDVPDGGLLSPYRLTDFVNYDHNALPWFTYSTLNDTPEYNSMWPSTLDNKTLEQIIKDIGTFNFAYNGTTSIPGVLFYGFILRNTSSSAVSTNCYYYRAGDWVNYYDLFELSMFIPDVSKLPEGSYNIVPVLTTLNKYSNGSTTYIDETKAIDLADSTWYLLPVVPLSITLTAPVIPPLVRLEDSYTYDVVVNQSTFDTTLKSIIITITNMVASSINVRVSFNIINAPVGSEVEDTFYLQLDGNQSLDISMLTQTGKYNPPIQYIGHDLPLLNIIVEYGASYGSSISRMYDLY